MDASLESSLEGQKLIEMVSELSGLDKEVLSEDLREFVERTGADLANLTLEELRRALALYLDEVLPVGKEMTPVGRA